MKQVSIKQVKEFWEENPLFQGESEYTSGSPEYFKQHRQVIFDDCLAGQLDKRLLPANRAGKILDLGCGPGFWTAEFFLSCHCSNIYSVDLTHKALCMTRERAKLYDFIPKMCQANAEMLPFKSVSFDHVNCPGVIHHTPETQKCVSEIARILKPNGQAVITVYYKNILLRNWQKLNKGGGAIIDKNRCCNERPRA